MVTKQEWIEAFRIKKPLENFGGYYGRIDRVIIREDGTRVMPSMLTTRPTKRVPFEVPFSFVMGSYELSKVFSSSSLEGILRDVISLDDISVKSRLSLVKTKQLDHILMIFSSKDIACQPASLQGMLKLLHIVHPETGSRFEEMIPQLQALVGPDQFQQRIELFQEYWDDWRVQRECMWLGMNHAPMIDSVCSSCKEYFSFAKFCAEYDALQILLEAESSATDDTTMQSYAWQKLVLTRKLMFILLSCNEYFGMDGYTYESTGELIGEEFLTINSPIETSISHPDDMMRVGINGPASSITCILFSEIDRFRADH